MINILNSLNGQEIFGISRERMGRLVGRKNLEPDKRKAAWEAAILSYINGAEDGTRTRMSVARHPLKMVCLPDSTTSA